MTVGLLGNKSSDSNRFTLVTPKSENDVRLQAKLGNQNPHGLPWGVVSGLIVGVKKISSMKKDCELLAICNQTNYNEEKRGGDIYGKNSKCICTC